MVCEKKFPLKMVLVPKFRHLTCCTENKREFNPNIIKGNSISVQEAVQEMESFD